MKISVVIPTYNEEKNIERCIGSLKRQTLHRSEYEIIVVDGNSSDMTMELAKKAGADKVILQKSEGVGGARNDGARIAVGDVVANTDADCILPSDWLERIKWNFEKDNIVCLFGPIKPIEKTRKFRYLIHLNNLAAFSLYKLGVFHATIGSNTIFRKREFLHYVPRFF